MLERTLVQSQGFRNTGPAGGKPTGFEFRLRLPNYRGLRASLSDGVDVTVDGETFPYEGNVLVVEGRELPLAQLREATDVRWAVDEAITVRVPRAGGLAAGVHEVAVGVRLRAPYIPIQFQPMVVNESRQLTLVDASVGTGGFKYGVSLYSYSEDFGTVLTLEDCMAHVASVGATGIEILGEAHVPRYPNPPAAWVGHWHAQLAKHGLEATNYGSWIDTRLRLSRQMTAVEAAEDLVRDIRLAALLGFRFVRPKIGVVSIDLKPDPIWQEAVERALPEAEKAGIVICPEIHAPTPIRHPITEDYVRFIERTGTKHFGLLIDTGIFQDRPLPYFPGETEDMRTSFLNGIKVPPADFLAVAKHVVFIQSKFHHIDKDLHDHHIPWHTVVPMLKAAGYTGYLSSEYEGERSPWASLEQVRRQHALLRRLAAASG